MRLVKFKNGKYGVRKGSWWSYGYEFFVLRKSDVWRIGETCIGQRAVIANCQGTLKEAQDVLEAIDTGTPVCHRCGRKH